MSNVTSPDDLSPTEREAVETLLLRLADDELVIGERSTEWAVVAPTIETDISMANIAQDELGHARLWYDLLGPFGYDEAALIYERDPETFRHATLTELVVDEGDWADAVVRSYLYDVAEYVRLTALETSRYRPIASVVGKLLTEEEYHREHARSWLERLAGPEDGRVRVQEALDRQFSDALTLFAESPGPSPAEHGFQSKSLDEMRDEWLETIEPELADLGLTVPSADLPETVGRDGSHTDAWPVLFEEMTETYHDMGRSEPTKIMDVPDFE